MDRCRAVVTAGAFLRKSWGCTFAERKIDSCDTLVGKSNYSPRQNGFQLFVMQDAVQLCLFDQGFDVTVAAMQV